MATISSGPPEEQRSADLFPRHPLPRRSFFHVAGKLAASAAVLPATLLPERSAAQQQSKNSYEVSTNEKLMREHGILRRVLQMYDEIIRRIHAGQDFPLQTAIDASRIVRTYIEDYHQKLEEDHIFPLFRRYYARNDVLRLYVQKLIDLVDILHQQHQAGRRLTDRILSALHSLKTPDDHHRLARDLGACIRMYSPHITREDTVLFPALHIVAGAQEYQLLGEKFNEIEQKTFGSDGFDIYLDQVTAFEKHLGIYDLAQFTFK
jgi:hemerythrin-like domain-containing protein